MSWAKLDDRFHENRKIKRAWRRFPAALGLHVMAITYCAGHATDGFVDAEFVEEKMPRERDFARAVEVLVDAGLWEAVEDGWVIHDFLDYNPSRSDREKQHQAKVEAGRRGGRAKWRKERITQSMRAAVAERLGVLEGERKRIPCHYCSAPLWFDRTGKTVKLLDENDAPTPELDHAQSLHDGGAHDATNLVPACLACNRSKGSRSSSNVTPASGDGLAAASAPPGKQNAPDPTRTRTTPKPPEGASASASENRAPSPVQRAQQNGFDEWLLDHATVTGDTPPKVSTKAYSHLAEMFNARLADGHSLGDLKLATRGAFGDPFRRENGHYGAESVLRPTKALKLINNGRRLEGATGDRRSEIEKFRAHKARLAERDGAA